MLITHTIVAAKNPKKAEKKVNRMVADGWQFVSLQPGRGELYLVFRREGPAPKPHKRPGKIKDEGKLAKAK
jgi:hypothetical protein